MKQRKRERNRHKEEVLGQSNGASNKEYAMQKKNKRQNRSRKRDEGNGKPKEQEKRRI